MRKKTQEPKQGLLKSFKPMTAGQEDYVISIAENDITICTGPAGSGKTAVSVGLAAEYLIRGKVKKLIITRPIVETGGHSIGYLPGTLREKANPYMIPVLEELYSYFGRTETESMIQYGQIEIAPLEFMRGRTLKDCFVILDEAQNATYEQLKMFITRIGLGSKFVINGDITQSDLGHKKAFEDFVGRFTDIHGIAMCELDNRDIVRHRLLGIILSRLGD